MKVLITRPRSQSESFAAALRNAGFEPIYFPVIEIRPVENFSELDEAIHNIASYDWVVFMSVNAVDVFLSRISPPLLGEGRVAGVRFAAIGPKTADALRKHNIEPDFIPDEYVAETILPGLGDVRGKRILLPQAELARKVLEDAIMAAGGFAHPITVYHTLPAAPGDEGLAALRSGVDVITLTSPSTVQNFVAIVRQNGLDPVNMPNNPLFACIGPITDQAAKEEGLINLIVAEEYTTEGLIKTISQLGVAHAQGN